MLTAAVATVCEADAIDVIFPSKVYHPPSSVLILCMGACSTSPVGSMVAVHCSAGNTTIGDAALIGVLSKGYISRMFCFSKVEC